MIFPVFTCVGSSKHAKDPVNNGPLSFKHRTLGESAYNQLRLLLDEVKVECVKFYPLDG